jgi:hypothetical protein
MCGLVREKISRGRQLQRSDLFESPPHGDAFGIPVCGQAVEEQEPGDLIHRNFLQMKYVFHLTFTLTSSAFTSVDTYLRRDFVSEGLR